ncbi:MAG: RagB/SusD family nutrient uptake outer membrane protein [Tannerellaceae bacterium]|jgi:tetratricopeptide (TPR) repeat protein|nr:RagB/SusD family nutrient uptake outer membrane protein [Tannerellaceae bacterium]
MKQYISKRKALGCAVSFIVLFASCTDYFLNPESPQYISDEFAITDAQSAETAVLGTYSALQHGEYYGGDGFQSAANLSGGDHIWVGTQNHYYTFVTHTYRPDNRTLNDSWNAMNQVVNRANQVIDKIPRLNVTGLLEETKKHWLGEAYTIRALVHFDLARAWGNIPIVTSPTTSPSSASDVNQSSQQEVYAHVLSDLETAEQLASPVFDSNRVNVYTIYAFKARVYLYLKQWDKAEEYASKLIGNIHFGLVGWDNILTAKNTKESIWELAFSTSDKSNYFSVWSSDSYRNTLAPSRTLYDLLHSGAGGERAKLVKDVSTDTKLDYYVQLLYWRPNNDNPTYLFRIAEQYLIRAEARAKKANPDLPGALSDLNAVRERANVEPATALTTGQIVLDIENERRLELAFEPHRWFDLVRTERAGEVLGITDRNKWIFPLPYNDVQTDANLNQNTGY